MAKGPKISNEVRRSIALVYLAHSDWKAKEIQEEVNRRLGGNGPGLSAVQKVLTPMRDPERQKQLSETGLDEPWSLGSMGTKPEYELPPEIIPIVLELKRARELSIKNTDPERVASANRIFRVRELEKLPGWVVKFHDGPQPFSVREAKWVARIRYVLPSEVTTEEIGMWAHIYAEFEKGCELADVECDTTNLDIGLSIGDYFVYLEWTLVKDIHDYAQQAVKDTEIKLFGYTLEDVELTPLAWALYCVWIDAITTRAKKWSSFSIEEQLETTKRLRNWVLEQEPVEELMLPEKLLAEIQYTRLIEKTVRNEITQ